MTLMMNVADDDDSNGIESLCWIIFRPPSYSIFKVILSLFHCPIIFESSFLLSELKWKHAINLENNEKLFVDVC